MNGRELGAALILVLGCQMLGQVRAESTDFVCGSLQNGYGPYDFRSDKDKLPIVERVHFTPDVANLVRGVTGTLGGELDYTLRAFPNHPGALMSMVKLGEREKTTRPQGARYTVDCYLQRAIRFRDDDAMVRMIYAAYLLKKNKNIEALQQLEGAVQLDQDNANLNYNIGLVYFELGKYDEALEYANRAYRGGFPLPGLRERLKKVGKWTSLPPEQAGEAQARYGVESPKNPE